MIWSGFSRRRVNDILGKLLKDQKDYRGAIKHLCHIKPDDNRWPMSRYEAHLACGESLLANHQPKLALDQFHIVSDLRPASAQNHVGVGKAFMAMRKFSDATFAFKHALLIREHDEATKNCLSKNVADALTAWSDELKNKADPTALDKYNEAERIKSGLKPLEASTCQNLN